MFRRLRTIESILKKSNNRNSLYLGGTYMLNHLKFMKTKAKDIDVFLYVHDREEALKVITEEFGKENIKIKSKYYKKDNFLELMIKVNDHVSIDIIIKPLSVKKFKDSGFKFKEIKVIHTEIILISKHRYRRWKDIKHKIDMILTMFNPNRITKLREGKEF